MEITESDRAAVDSFAIAAGTIDLARQLTEFEKNKLRKGKKQRAIRIKVDSFNQAFKEELGGTTVEGSALALLKTDWTESTAVPLLCELAFTQPFFPYDLKIAPRDFASALAFVAQSLGLSQTQVDQVLKAKKAALRSQKNLNWKKVTVISIGGGAALAVGGWALAPLIGGVLGSAAGLSGAAAVSHGLALLGGGSLAAGGSGIAGGLWLIATTGAVVGGGAIGGGQLLLEIGAARARLELAKLQTSFRVLVLSNQIQLKKAQEVIKSLVQQRKEIESSLREERALNDKNSRRLKDIEATLGAVETAISWMEKEEAV